MERNVYIIRGKYGIDCFSNLSKLIKAYPLFTYHPIYDALNKNKELLIGGYHITKTKLK